MNREHFSVKDEGECRLQHLEGGDTQLASYRMGHLLTGRQRVFSGYQIVITLAGKEIVAQSQGYSESYRPVLRECNQILAAQGLRLQVAGNAPRYSESPMSGGAGYGYVEGVSKALKIMSECP